MSRSDLSTDKSELDLSDYLFLVSLNLIFLKNMNGGEGASRNKHDIC